MIVLDVRLVTTFMASKVVNCSSNAAISSMESRRLPLGSIKAGRTGAVVSFPYFRPRGPWFETWPRHSLLWP